ncbi:hypothetical protein [Nocardia pseudobrasiliensis]|uniref:Uncharacterized protein n=1 Tax=Nocardia pseudobrasiliensis TaxID=45979 RepID=A0A370IBY4_9NOCA|nr:hypothetical protein [Nocardia pseudobrasiliensis]RDI68217.1 hypothetical protein DFR76_102618 [Nocardia pseudobrasiliensis]
MTPGVTREPCGGPSGFNPTGRRRVGSESFELTDPGRRGGCESFELTDDTDRRGDCESSEPTDDTDGVRRGGSESPEPTDGEGRGGSDSFEPNDDAGPGLRSSGSESADPNDDTDGGLRCDCPATIFGSDAERDDWMPLLGGCDAEPSLPGTARVPGGPPAGRSLAPPVTDEPRPCSDRFDDGAFSAFVPDELPLLPE